MRWGGGAILSLGAQIASSQCNKAMGFGLGYWLTYNSPGIFLCALILLMCFAKKKHLVALAEKTVDIIMPSVFAVYLIHDNPWIRTAIGHCKIFEFIDQFNAFQVVLTIIGCAFGVFTLCIVLDIPRRCVVKYIKALCAN